MPTDNFPNPLRSSKRRPTRNDFRRLHQWHEQHTHLKGATYYVTFQLDLIRLPISRPTPVRRSEN